MPFGFFFIALAVVAVVFIFGVQAARKRRDALSALAQRLGLSFYPDHVEARNQPEGFFDQLFSGNRIAGPAGALSPFKTGSSRTASNTLLGRLSIGDRSCELWAGDYRYTTGSGKKKSTHHRSYVAVRVPHGCSDVACRPENFFDSLTSMVGFDDIDFESEAFSRRFHISSPDRKFTFALFEPAMMEFLMADSPRGNTAAFQLLSGWLLIYGSTMKPEEFEAAIGWCERFFQHGPRHLQQSPSPAQPWASGSMANQ